MNKLLTLAAAALAALSIAAGTASADNSPYGGALNMANPNALPGMGNAMTQNLNGNGNNGMYCAVFITNGSYTPGTCNATTPLP